MTIVASGSATSRGGPCAAAYRWTSRLFDEPVTVTDLRARGITDLEVQKIPQGANPSWLTVAQLAAVSS